MGVRLTRFSPLEAKWDFRQASSRGHGEGEEADGAEQAAELKQQSCLQLHQIFAPRHPCSGAAQGT